MSFSGTQQKCKACGLVVHFAEMMTADGVPYHKTCFRCNHCNSRLTLSGYSSMDGQLYCRPHFEQLFKETGGISKRAPSPGNPELGRTPSKLSSLFSGTQEKCAVCNKTVYPLEKVTVEGAFYHKSCFRCAHAGCFLTTSNYAALDGILYCKPHFSQLFKQKGCYNHLTKTTSMRKTAASEEGNEQETKSEPDAEVTQEPESAAP